NPLYYMGWVMLLPLVYLGFKLHRRRQIFLIIERIRGEWGRELKKDHKFEDISRLYRGMDRIDESQLTIDDQTWHDLNMDSIFKKIDRTTTSFGQQILYSMLRIPLLEKRKLLKRHEIINLFQKNTGIREDILLRLNRLNSSDRGVLYNLIWGEASPDSGWKWIYYTFPVFLLGTLVLIPFMGAIALIRITMPDFMMNIYLYYRAKAKMKVYLDSISSLSSFLVIAHEIGNMKLDEPILEEYIAGLKSACIHCRRIMKKTRKLQKLESRDPFGLNEYIKMLSFMDIRALFAVLEDLRINREHLQKIYKTLGKLDALLSIASFRAGLSRYCIPNFSSGEDWIEIQEMEHPLIQNAVPNSVRLEKNCGLIVTGSNMSGKSTFMRTIGVNAIFAQTIYTCLADSYGGGFFRIMTSISQEDNIVGGKSYFLSEAESLLRIIKGLNDKIPTLCIIDEIFRGTNSEERIGAAQRLLEYMVKQNAAVIVATHDLELTQIDNPSYRCYHFSEKVGQTGLEFDFKLKKGVSTTRNALKILGHLGYPSEIASRRVK
ncbi:MAG TPA: hypothetical protein VFD89_08230, partial [Clostridia bacterium]|nr:hypothetical protein [Clostridia bacterium]